VCHFPPGTSKWNKVEHRLFSHITMNWRGRPLTSHEVIVQTIASTTTRTGLRVRAELDASAYDTGVRISDGQMDALPLARHDWHGDWNYALRPEPYDQAGPASYPFDQPSPGLAWLCHPGLTGLPARQWKTLISALMTLYDQQREADLEKRRGHRRLAAPGTGRRPVLTLADRLLATAIQNLRRYLGYDVQYFAAGSGAYEEDGGGPGRLTKLCAGVGMVPATGPSGGASSRGLALHGWLYNLPARPCPR
jgi:hypothetical protein